MINIIKKLFKIFKKEKVYKNYFLKDNLKKEIETNLAEVGKWSYGNPSIYRWDWKSKVIIGNFCSLGPDINFYVGGDHRADWISTSPLPASQFNKTFKKTKSIKVLETFLFLLLFNGLPIKFDILKIIYLFFKHWFIFNIFIKYSV
jgi:hypothetical protein